MEFRGRGRPRFGFRGMIRPISSSPSPSLPLSHGPSLPSPVLAITATTAATTTMTTTTTTATTIKPVEEQTQRQLSRMSIQEIEEPTAPVQTVITPVSSSTVPSSASREEFRQQRNLPVRSTGGAVIRQDFSRYPDTINYPIVRSGQYDAGLNGRKIELLANFMLINVQPTIVFQYDLEFKFKNSAQKSATISIADNERMQKFFAQIIPQLVDRFVHVNGNVFSRIVQFVYDNGKNIYTTEDIDISVLIKEFDDEINGRKKEFIVTVTKVQTIDLSKICSYYSGQISGVTTTTTAINFLEILFQNICRKKFQLHGRNLYDVENGLLRGSNNRWLQFVKGFSTAVHRTQMGPSLNLHLKTSCMISLTAQTLFQLVAMLSDGRDPKILSANDIERVNRMIRGLRVYSKHMGRKIIYKIKSLVSNKPKQVSFMMRDGGDEERSTTVYDYFMAKYSIQLKDYPVVQLVGRQNFFMPLELLYMVDNQFLNKSKIDATTQNDLLHASTHKPLIYFNHLSSFVTEIAEMDPDKMNHFGAN
ncbi:hypothetical protein BLA29_002987, partial [Euroglyphus maynei]